MLAISPSSSVHASCESEGEFLAETKLPGKTAVMYASRSALRKMSRIFRMLQVESFKLQSCIGIAHI
jgi:hypothetical protein